VCSRRRDRALSDVRRFQKREMTLPGAFRSGVWIDYDHDYDLDLVLLASILL